jgi:hypothetical protein
MALASLVYALALLWLKNPQAADFFDLLVSRFRRGRSRG